MPPKPRFTREEVVEAALALVSEEGVEGLTARELGKRLGSSSQPIFTVFADMGEVRDAVYAAARRRMREYLGRAAGFTPAFKQAGMQAIRFAIEEPKLFQMLMMAESEAPESFDEMFAKRGGDSSDLIDFMMKSYELTRDEAKALFQHAWIYTYGISVLCATKMCTFTEEELLQKVGVDFQAMMMYIKSGHLGDQTPVPEPVGEDGAPNTA